MFSVPGLLPGANVPSSTTTLPPIVPLPPSVPPLCTVTVVAAVPSVPFTSSRPADTVVLPANAPLLPVSVVVPAPVCARAPAPVIGALIVSAPLLLNASAPPAFTAKPLVPATEPPLPICSVPAVIVVAPV